MALHLDADEDLSFWMLLEPEMSSFSAMEGSKTWLWTQVKRPHSP